MHAAEVGLGEEETPVHPARGLQEGVVVDHRPGHALSAVGGHDIEERAQRDRVRVLHEEGGLSVDEIALVTGADREAVKSRLRYALDKLRRGMGDLL